jgi:tetratricopeptide (TPR) repeat protein
MSGLSNSTMAESTALTPSTSSATTGTASFADQLKAARDAVAANPKDPRAHLALADVLRKGGRAHDAIDEYLETTNLDPSIYIAYHQIAALNADADKMDEAITRLTKLKDERPKELMLRVALSELLEKRQSYYQAARVLIDLVYTNGIPVKHRPQINARIHYLLTRAKEAQMAEKDEEAATDGLDVVPAPLPDNGHNNHEGREVREKGLTASKIKESKEMKGMGHVPLQP